MEEWPDAGDNWFMAAQPTFLTEPPQTEATARMYEDRSEDGYVWNVTRLWAWRPDVQKAFVALRTGLMDGASLGERDWAVLVAATAAQRNDSYCSLAWGAKLAQLADAAPEPVRAAVTWGRPPAATASQP